MSTHTSHSYKKHSQFKTICNKVNRDNRVRIRLQLGLSLLELLIALSVFSFTYAFFIPYLDDYLLHSKMVSRVNEFSMIVRLSRFTAIDIAKTVRVCPTINGVDCVLNWNNQIMAFVDEDNNGKFEQPERLLKMTSLPDPQIHLSGPKKTVTFYDSGINSSPASVTFCPANKKEKFARAIIISLQGRARLSKDHDKNGVHEAQKGKNLKCI